jgi:hypothetical protein
MKLAMYEVPLAVMISFWDDDALLYCYYTVVTTTILHALYYIIYCRVLYTNNNTNKNDSSVVDSSGISGGYLSTHHRTPLSGRSMLQYPPHDTVKCCWFWSRLYSDFNLWSANNLNKHAHSYKLGNQESTKATATSSTFAPRVGTRGMSGFPKTTVVCSLHETRGRMVTSSRYYQPRTCPCKPVYVTPPPPHPYTLAIMLSLARDPHRRTPVYVTHRSSHMCHYLVWLTGSLKFWGEEF